MTESVPILASLEGISGSGKTYFANLLRSDADSAKTLFVPELSERKSGSVDHDIISVLHRENDRFLRLGSPGCETFLLMALKIWDHDAIIVPALDKGMTVFEDRSIDTIAVYQAVMLHWREPEPRLATAREILALAARWRRSPDLTFLIEDEFESAINRAQIRENRTFSEDELHILSGAAELYPQLAELNPARFVRLDRRQLSSDEILAAIKTHARNARPE